jgi:hypothetical protein
MSKKTDQHYFNFGLRYPWFLWPETILRSPPRDWSLVSWGFLHFNTKFRIHFLFPHTLYFHVWTKSTVHSNLTSYCSTNIERNLFRLSVCVLLYHLVFQVTALADSPTRNYKCVSKIICQTLYCARVFISGGERWGMRCGPRTLLWASYCVCWKRNTSRCYSTKFMLSWILLFTQVRTKEWNISRNYDMRNVNKTLSRLQSSRL